MNSAILANATDLIRWSDTAKAATDLPQLVRRLILALGRELSSLEMRGGEGIRLGGLDGVVRAGSGTWFVPEGTSMWELSIHKSVGAKANRDFEKRTTEVDSSERLETTYVHVSSRRWPGKQKWMKEKSHLGEWRDVIAFDVDDLELALQASPSIHIWFSEYLGKLVTGLEALSSWWSRLSTSVMPNLTPELALAGRFEAAESFMSTLLGGRSQVVVCAKSVMDGLGFIAASMIAVKDSKFENTLNRSIYAKDQDSFAWLLNQENIIAIVGGCSSTRYEIVNSNAKTIIVCADDFACDFVVPSLNQVTFAQMIANQVGDPEDTARLARAAAGSLETYRRIASIGGQSSNPTWTAQAREPNLRRLWFLGGWDTSNKHDVSVIENCLGANISAIANQLMQSVQIADPMFVQVDSQWRVGEPEATFDYVRSNLTFADWNAFEKAVDDVLGTVDPSTELDVDKRWAAGIFGKSRPHSVTLRTGIATTLALLGAHGDSVRVGDGITATDFVQSAMYRLFKRANEIAEGHLWTSLSDVVPLLAEAAPNQFLNAIQQGIEGPDPVIATQFLDNDSDIFVSSPHSAILFALETLSWSEQLAARSTAIMASLAVLDPNPDSRNLSRPFNSLVYIFSSWMPQTSAGTDSRINILSGIVRRNPEIADKLLIELLPKSGSFLIPNQQPKFRGWVRSAEPLSIHDFLTYQKAITHMIVDRAVLQPAYWLTIAEHLTRFIAIQRMYVIDCIEKMIGAGAISVNTQALWSILGKTLRRSLRHPDQTEVLSELEVGRVQKIVESLEPEDRDLQHQWLFDDYMPDLERKENENYSDYATSLNIYRVGAVQEILESHGLDRIIALASRVSQPWTVGNTLGSMDIQDDISIIELLDSKVENEVDFAFAYVAARSCGDTTWLFERALKFSGRGLVQARLLQAGNEFPRIWGKSLELGTEVSALYWKEFKVQGRGFDFRHVTECASSLIEHDRPAAALALISLYCSLDKGGEYADATILALEKLMKGLNPDDERALSNMDFELLLDYLRDSGADSEVVAYLEWRLLPAIGVTSNSPVLETRLARDPAFFIEILSLAFPEKAGSFQELPPMMSHSAFRLLQDWRHIPGAATVDASIDSDRLSDWLAETRRRLHNSNLAIEAELAIGRVLARSTIEPDGTWPAVQIRDAIEKTGSTHLDIGFVLGITNMRGASSRGLGEGGDQERELALKYDLYADQIKDEWPRTAANLRAVAEQYKQEANMHDGSAKRFRQGFSA